jgi:hypothetical protein
MENNPDYEMAMSAARRLVTFMARTDSDPVEVRIAKGIFRWGSIAVGASVVAVAVL